MSEHILWETINEQKEQIEELEMTVGTLRTFSNEQAACIERLQNENAELKTWKEDTIKARGNDYMAWSRQNNQLAQAKEIIRWFVVYEKGEGIITNFNNFLEQAEQFLKE